MILKCALILSFVLPAVVRSTSDFEKRLDDLARRVQHLEMENQELKTTKATLEERVEYLEAITRRIVPPSCQDLQHMGVTKSGSYLIDPDGAGLGSPPITVMCEMTPTGGTTIIPHNLMDIVTEVEHCPDPGCHSTEIIYDVPVSQMRALMDLSSECSQEIKYDCFAAPLIENGAENMAWWTGADGENNFYWDGSHSPTDHTCACNEDGSCINEIFTCNCDTSAPQWLEDLGILTNMTALPVTSVSFGGLVFDGQQASFTVGPLSCQGRKEFKATESCDTLRMAGHVTSGYYFIDGPEGLHYNLVFCNMELEANDGDFQVETGGRMPEFPVAFHAQEVTNPTGGGVLKWTSATVNVGNAFDRTTGEFVAPFDGVYKFTLFVLDNSNTANNVLKIRMNGAEVAHLDDDTASDANPGTSSISTILVLSEGDAVDAYSARSIDGGPLHSQYMGHLLFVL